MANDNATAGASAGTSDGNDEKNTAGTGQPTDTEAASETTNTETSGKTFDQETLNAIVAKTVAKERAKWEKDSKLSDAERHKAENEDLRRQLNERNAFDVFDAAAEKAGVKNKRGLFKALKSDITYDKDGNIEDVKALLKSAETDFPEFFATKNLGDADGSRGSSSGAAGAGNTSVSSMIRRGFGRG